MPLQLVVQNDRPPARMRHISRAEWFGRRDTNGSSRSAINLNHTPAALPRYMLLSFSRDGCLAGLTG